VEHMARPENEMPALTDGRNEPTYELSAVSKRYQTGRRTILALEDVDLRIEEGEWLAVQGRTGSGKTTLLQMLGALDRPTAGTIQLAGHDIVGMPDAQLTALRARSIGFIFQTFNLLPTLSAVENVEAALVPLRIPAAERRAAAIQAMDSVGLADRTSHLPSQLSGGQQQRVGIARALVKQPKVLLADEPTGNLDGDTSDEIVSLIEGLWREHHLTLVLVTHDGTIAGQAQRVGRMSDGQLSFATNADDRTR
jgi:putative ABC transport system ATP-binding protein